MELEFSLAMKEPKNATRVIFYPRHHEEYLYTVEVDMQTVKCKYATHYVITCDSSSIPTTLLLSYCISLHSTDNIKTGNSTSYVSPLTSPP
jgi:hypothetical protein